MKTASEGLTITLTYLWILVGHLDFVYPINCELEGKGEMITMQRWKNILQKHLNVKCLLRREKAIRREKVIRREKAIRRREKYNLTLFDRLNKNS